jgi:hypothetical protein
LPLVCLFRGRCFARLHSSMQLRGGAYSGGGRQARMSDVSLDHEERAGGDQGLEVKLPRAS